MLNKVGMIINKLFHVFDLFKILFQSCFDKHLNNGNINI